MVCVCAVCIISLPWCVHVCCVFCARQVSIVSLRKGGLQVRSHAWDSNLGGRDFDELLFNHFAVEFKVRIFVSLGG